MDRGLEQGGPALGRRWHSLRQPGERGDRFSIAYGGIDAHFPNLVHACVIFPSTQSYSSHEFPQAKGAGNTPANIYLAYLMVRHEDPK